MAYYTICGKPDCVNFAHAAYVAQYLYEHLPNFKYMKIEKSKLDWPDFVANLNKKHKWFMVKSPIIWKEISTWGGKPYLIGGLGEFWEYCYCYYGLDSVIPKADLQNLANDNVKFFLEEQEKNFKKDQTFNVVISILGAGSDEILEHLLEEFHHIPAFFEGNGFYVKLYEVNFVNEEYAKEKKYLQSVVNRINAEAIFGDRKVVAIVDSLTEAVEQTDLLIMLEDYSRNEDEDFFIWRKRCIGRIAILSDAVNINGKRPLKVIFCNEGPRCLMATCMVEYCTLIIPENIVALTADRGLPVINVISELTGLSISKIGAPPVWGFVGWNEYVDEANILFKASIFKPYKRALTAPKGSTLPLGTVVPELRLMSYLVPDQHDKITQIVKAKRLAIEASLHRKPLLSKLRALSSLLKIWYSEEMSDQIISLGVCSNGLYDIPPGMVFSQPSILDKRRRWRPVFNYPLINDTTRVELKKLIQDASTVVGEILSVNEPRTFSITSKDVMFPLVTHVQD